VKHHDNGDETPYATQEEAEIANEGPGIINQKQDNPAGTKQPMSMMDQQAAEPGPQVSAMAKQVDPDATYKQALESYMAGDFQNAYNTISEVMKDPAVAKDSRFKQLWQRVKVKLNIG